MLNCSNDDIDQLTTCEAPVRWSKYSTSIDCLLTLFLALYRHWASTWRMRMSKLTRTRWKITTRFQGSISGTRPCYSESRNKSQMTENFAKHLCSEQLFFQFLVNCMRATYFWVYSHHTCTLAFLSQFLQFGVKGKEK